MEPWKLKPARDLNLSLFEQLRSPRREAGLVASFFRQTWSFLTRAYLAIWHRLRIHGSENLPRRAPFVLVSNHCSHLDALVLSAMLPWQLRECAFPLAAGDAFFESPWSVALAANLLNALPVWRRKHGSRTFQTLRQRLIDEACIYILFPEGTRSRDGRMGPFKAGVGMLVAGLEVPIVPCRLNGCFDSLPPGGKLPRRRPIDLYIGTPLRFGHLGSDKPGWLAIAGELEEAVRGLR